MLDKRDNDLVETLRHDKNVCVAFGALLSQKHPGGFLKESLTDLNEHVPYLHTKYMLVDAFSDAPMLITGSANFSEASTRNNDENMLLIYKDTRVADIYLCEYMRLFEHFAFRDYTGASSGARHLAPDHSWTNAHYQAGSLLEKQRLLFA
jgi:phosphatidylserine/phosphatidylglycerophosphate/cardiolipin synthase-like enzyme